MRSTGGGAAHTESVWMGRSVRYYDMVRRGTAPAGREGGFGAIFANDVPPAARRAPPAGPLDSGLFPLPLRPPPPATRHTTHHPPHPPPPTNITPRDPLDRARQKSGAMVPREKPLTSFGSLTKCTAEG